jgi:hypothetical protein
MEGLKSTIIERQPFKFIIIYTVNSRPGYLYVKTATEVGVRAIQDHKMIEWNTCWKCRLSEGSDDK